MAEWINGVLQGGSGDMLKSVYDADLDTHVTTAEALNDGAGSTLTAAQGAAANTHVSSDGTNHANVVLNDAHRASDGKDHADVVTNNAKVGVTTQISNVVEDTTPQFGGVMDENGFYCLSDPDLSSDHTVHGRVATFSAGEALVFGDFCCIASDGAMSKADADLSTGVPVLAMAISTIVSDALGRFLIEGWARDDSWNWTVAPEKPIYAHTTAGAGTQTAPSGSGDQVQVIAEPIHADKILFDPSMEVMEVI